MCAAAAIAIWCCKNRSCGCLRWQEAPRSCEAQDGGVRGGQGLLLARGALFRALLPLLLRAGRCGRRGGKRRRQLLLLLLQGVEDQRTAGKLEQIQGPET